MRERGLKPISAAGTLLLIISFLLTMCVWGQGSEVRDPSRPSNDSSPTAQENFPWTASITTSFLRLRLWHGHADDLDLLLYSAYVCSTDGYDAGLTILNRERKAAKVRVKLIEYIGELAREGHKAASGRTISVAEDAHTLAVLREKNFDRLLEVYEMLYSPAPILDDTDPGLCRDEQRQENLLSEVCRRRPCLFFKESHFDADRDRFLADDLEERKGIAVRLQIEYERLVSELEE